MTLCFGIVLAMLIDALIGWPTKLHRAIGHPATWIGALVTLEGRSLNSAGASEGALRLKGLLMAVLVVALIAAPFVALDQIALPQGALAVWGEVLLTAVLIWPFLSTRWLWRQGSAAEAALTRGDLEEAAAQIDALGGDKPGSEDEAGLTRSSLEGLAAGTSNRVVGPVFWALLLGPAGAAGYTAVLILDRLVGARVNGHQHFGFGASAINDVVTSLPARLAGFFLCLVGSRSLTAFETMVRDRKKHPHPNAGWTEAALAGQLDCRLAGPREAVDGRAKGEWLNEDAPDPLPDAISSTLVMIRRVAVMVAFMLVIGGAIFGFGPEAFTWIREAMTET